MGFMPVVAHYRYYLDEADEARLDNMAHRYLTDDPDIAADESVWPMMAKDTGQASALHIDDASNISLMAASATSIFLQDRARLRAADGDFVASCTPPIEGFDRYCETYLSLGSVHWLRIASPRNAWQLAASCWTDPAVRKRLVHEARRGRIERIHPYMGNFHVWALARLLSAAARRPIEVLAPPPGLTRKVNDKTWFASVVTELLGSEYIPESYYASNFTTLARVVKQLTRKSNQIIVKLPDSAGGKGNLLLDSEDFAGLSASEVRAHLREALETLHWHGECRLLVSCWEEAVVCPPSVQLWIPPAGSGPPVIEGLFIQTIESQRGDFRGSVPAVLPAAVESEIVGAASLLAGFFQRLGYVGRCSFDLLLVGKDLNSCRMKLIECNGRWGGTSGPMTLVNRWFGDWMARPYATRLCHVPGLEKRRFGDLLGFFEADLFQAGRDNGWLALLDATGLPFGRINILALGDDLAQAHRRANEEIPARLRVFASGNLSESNAMKTAWNA